MSLDQLDPNIIIPSVIAAYAAIRAGKAERNSRPVSNGFADSVKTSLRALESHLEDVHKDVREVRTSLFDHFKNHP
jgi:TFIIF-interacting CTD phosphatase-like protein